MKIRRNGFTLLELLAVISILAVLIIITVPMILKTTNDSKKDSFYLYAQSMQDKAEKKYIQDADRDRDKASCVVYDIAKDLDITNHGNYDGWVKVERVATNSGSSDVTIDLSNPAGISSLRYCVSKVNASVSNGTCSPDESYQIESGSNSVRITKKVPFTESGKDYYAFCVKYQYPVNGVLKDSDLICKYYNDGEKVNDSYKYKIVMSLTDKKYSVENLVFSNTMEESKFFDAIDDFKSTHNNLEIKSPVCGSEDETVKGTTTTHTVTVTTSSSGDKSTVVVTPTEVTTKQTVTVTTEKETTKVTVHPNEQTTTTRGSVDNGYQTTTSRGTVIEETTTVDVKDESLQLRSLVVSGFDIGFNPLKYYYNLDVPNSVESLSVSAATKVEGVQVNISGNDIIEEGNSAVIVSLYNESTGRSSNYTIKVHRSAAPNEKTTTIKTEPVSSNIEGLPDPLLDESNSSLGSLFVNGYSLDFASDLYDYDLVTYGEKKLDIIANPEVAKASVEIFGADDVANGSQVVINVKSANGYYNSTYTINIKFKDGKKDYTFITRMIAIGLGVVLIALLIIINIRKKKMIKM